MEDFCFLGNKAFSGEKADGINYLLLRNILLQVGNLKLQVFIISHRL